WDPVWRWDHSHPDRGLALAEFVRAGVLSASGSDFEHHSQHRRSIRAPLVSADARILPLRSVPYLEASATDLDRGIDPGSHGCGHNTPGSRLVFRRGLVGGRFATC